MSWELLRDLTHETSVDFATLYFIRTLMDQRNVQWQSRFAALVRELRARSTLSIRKDLEKRMELSLFRFLFVPGFHYRTDPSSGADFAGPRTYLRNCGFDTQLVEVEEDGTIEQNAAFIAAAIGSLHRQSGRPKRSLPVLPRQAELQAPNPPRLRRFDLADETLYRLIESGKSFCSTRSW